MVRVQNKSILRRKEESTMPQIRLYNSDCIEAMKNIEDHTIDLIVTDPPYNLGNFMKNRDTNLSKMRDKFFWLRRMGRYGVRRVGKINGHIL